MRLGGKRAIVTGPNRSIGRAIAMLFAEEGADAAGAQETLALVERIGRRGVALGADFSDRAEISHFFDQATAFLGGIDILVNCAAGYDTTAFLDLSIETFDHLLQVGVVAPFVLTQFAAKQMIRQKSPGP